MANSDCLCEMVMPGNPPSVLSAVYETFSELRQTAIDAFDLYDDPDVEIVCSNEMRLTEENYPLVKDYPPLRPYTVHGNVLDPDDGVGSGWVTFSHIGARLK